MKMSVLLTNLIICLNQYVVPCLSVHLGKNGYPKFPAPIHSCGRRMTYWRPNREPKVIGGEETPHGAVPWQVALRHHGAHRCGAVVISKEILLTAAHCYSEDMVAVAGSNDQHETGSYKQYVKIHSGYLHPDYRKLGPYSNDIAVLILESPGFKFNERIKPVCLSHNAPQAGTWCEVSGWGSHDPNNPGRPSNVLRSAAVPILSMETCRKRSIYGGRYQPILDNMLCAGHLRGGIDACGGDSGSPLICEIHGQFELAGLVSWGEGCAKKYRPGVYTKVASFYKWIRETATEQGLTI